MIGRLDLGLGVLATASGIAIALGGDATRGPVWANVAAFVAFGVLVAARNRAPVPAHFGYVALLALLGLVLTPPQDVIVVSLALALFSYGAGTSSHPALRWAYLPALLAAIGAANLGVDGTAVGDWIFPMALSVAAFLAGRNTIYRASLAAELEDANLRAEEAQGEEELRAVAAERRRIAREMHDIVAHSISVMVVQAGGARRILQRDATRAEQAAAQIERTGRETLAEMRRLLGVMHGGSEPAELEPNPTLADLDGLCRRAGATLRRSGDPRPIPLGLEIGVFRVVQEALEDSSRTVPGAVPAVELEWGDDELLLRIDDDRPYRGPELPGVRERVALYEGEIRQGTANELIVSFPLHNDAVPLPGA